MRSNRDLEVFASKVAHEVKSPLICAKSWLQLLCDKENKHDEAMSSMASEIVHRNLDLSIQIIDDLLKMSQLECNQTAHVAFELSPIVEHIIQAFDSDIKIAGATLVVGDLPTLVGNPVQIECVLANLLKNALLYRDPARALKIEIGSKCWEECYEILISDSGSGVPSEKLEEIFDLFQRIHSQESHPGSGIGLAHCKRVITLHGGKIWAENNLTHGATFKFTIPRRTYSSPKILTRGLSTDL